MPLLKAGKTSLQSFHEAGVNGGTEWRCGRPGGSVESQHLVAADGCQGGGAEVPSGNPLLFLLHEWGGRPNCARVATAGQIQILISGYGIVPCKGETAALEVSCSPLAIQVHDI